MILRETALVRGIGWALAGWAGSFALACVWLGDRLTSKQWQYLMSVPGGKWFWAVLFGASAITVAASVWCNRYGPAAAGLFTMGAGCTGIALFYVAAPVLDDGLITLGSFPWSVCAGVMYLTAVANWRPIPWF